TNNPNASYSLTSCRVIQWAKYKKTFCVICTLKYTTIKKGRLFPANCLQPVGTVLLHCRRSPISKISVSDGEWQSATVGFNSSRRRSLAHPDFLSSQSLFGFQAQIPSCSVTPTSS